MDKVEQSIRIIRALHDERKENIIAFSGGKDSVVLYDLAKKSGKQFTYIYSNTTIDPPGHLTFIRNNFPDVIVSNPRYSFYELIAKYGLPTRQNRFCCQHLKEYVGKGAKVFEGLRIEEGVKRGKRLSKLKEPEVCDTRVKGKIHAYPIMHWSEVEIWQYIHENHIPYSKFYDLGFHRLGCIGCPLGVQKQRMKEYTMFPRYAYATIKAIDKNIKAGKSISKFFSDPYEAFCWWISEKPISAFKITGWFKDDFKERVENMFPIKK